MFHPMYIGSTCKWINQTLKLAASTNLRFIWVPSVYSTKQIIQKHVFSSEMTCCCFSLLPNNSQGRCSSRFFNIWDKNSSNTVSFLATYLPWENRQHFVMPSLVSQQNDIWETSREIPYWWCVTTQIWGVILIGWKFTSSNQKHNQDLGSVSQTLFSGETINGVIKCWLFSRVTTTTYAA